MQKGPNSSRQLVGPFRPTAYGRTLLPTLTGLLSAAAALKDEMSARGMSEDSLPAADELERFIESSPAGQKVVDVGRIISEIELRDGSGATLAYETIGFLDLGSLTRRFATHPSATIRRSAPPPSSRVLVSATLAPRRTSALAAPRIEIT